MSKRDFSLSSLIAAIFAWGAVGASAPAGPPAWWVARGVTTSAAADDYAIANNGQLKNLIYAAMLEFDSRLPGGGGAALHNLVQSWINPSPLPAPQPDDYAALNQGQLKSGVKLIYDRLVAAGKIPANLAGLYPWTNSVNDDDDYIKVNIGQLKNVFDFDLANPDRDGDGLPDLLELVVFKTSPGLVDSDGNGIADGLEDSDADGIQNLDELAFGLNPTIDDGGLAANIENYTYDTLARLSSVTAPGGGTATNIVLDNESNITTISH